MTPRADEAPASDEQHSLNLKEAIRTRSFWLLSATLFCFFFYQVGVLDHLVLFLTDAGMERSEAAAYFSTAVFLGIFSKVILGLIADRIVAQGVDRARLRAGGGELAGADPAAHTDPALGLYRDLRLLDRGARRPSTR